MQRDAYRVAVGFWGIQPSEFWQMEICEWWWLVEPKTPRPPLRAGMTEAEIDRHLERLKNAQ